MIRVRQRIPAWVETDKEPYVVEAQTTAELLADPRIAHWAQDDPYVRNGVHGVRKWHRFSVADNDALMGEWDNGDHFWVIAHILKGSDTLDLPEWQETETARLRRERWNQGITTE